MAYPAGTQQTGLSTTAWMLIGGGGVGLLMVIVGLFLFSRSDSQPMPTAAANQQDQDNAANSRGEQGASPSTSGNATRSSSTLPTRSNSPAGFNSRSSTGVNAGSSNLGGTPTTPTTSTNSTSTRGNVIPGVDSDGLPATGPRTIKGFGLESGPDEKRDELPPAPTQWSATPDPPTEAYEVLAKKLELPFPKEANVRYSWTDTPFLCVTRTDRQSQAHMLLDLRTQKVTGTVELSFGFMDQVAFSPGGKYLAGTSDKDTKLRLHTFPKGDKFAELDKEENLAALEFASDREMLVFYRGAATTNRSGSQGAASATGRLERWELGDQPVKAEEAVLPPGVSRNGIALSPGRRTLALVANGALHFYKLPEIAKLGEAALPNDMAQLECLALAFSPDGTELCALLEKRYSNMFLICWDVATGKTTLIREYERSQLSSSTFIPANYMGRKVEWMPDGNGWLLFGFKVVDRVTGEILLALPESGYQPRRFIDQRRLLGVSQRNRYSDGVIGTAELPMAEIGKMQAAVRAGNKALDGQLGTLVDADLNQAALKSPPPDGLPWSVTAIVPPKSITYPRRPLPLENAQYVRAIRFSNADSKYVGVMSSQGQSSVSLLKRYNLSAHKDAGQFDIPVASSLLDMSPTGELALSVTHGPRPQDRDRLDVYSFAGNTHVVGWRPYRNVDASNPRSSGVVWAAFHGEEHVLTLNEAGILVCWKLPDVAPVWRMPAVGATAVLSPDGQYVITGQGFVIDAASGDCVGALEPPVFGPAVKSLAFSPEGQQLVALAHGGSEEHFILEWDFATGKIASQFWIAPFHDPLPEIQALRDRYVLICGKVLVSLDRKATIGEYNTYYAAPISGPDGYVWLALSSKGSPQKKSLTAVQLPHPEAQQLMANATFYNQVLLYPGAKVNVADDVLAKRMEAAGFVIDPTATVTASISSSQESTGRVAEYRRIGSPNTIRIEEKMVRHAFTISDNRGRSWSRTASSGMGLGYSIQVPEGNVQQHFDQKLQNAASGFNQGVSIPRCVFPPREQLGITPSNISLDGIENVRPPSPPSQTTVN